MTHDDPDLELRKRFAESRRADESAAPDFGALLGRPRRAGTTRSPGRRLALAASLALAAAAAALLLRERPPSPGAGAGAGDLPPAAGALVAWKSPTASLLRTPGAELSARVPALVPRVPVFAAVTLPQTTKGADR